MAGVGRVEVGAGRPGFARHPIPNELAPHHSESNALCSGGYAAARERQAAYVAVSKIHITGKRSWIAERRI